MSHGQRILTGALVALVLAVVVVIVVLQPFSHDDSGNGGPHYADFYAAPAHVPAEPGKLIRSEVVFAGVPDGAQAWRILYTTTRRNGAPAVASALVIQRSDQTSGPHPVIAWAHGTSGFAQKCAPSLQMDPTVFGGIPGADKVLAKGWVLVATDYTGLGTKGPQPYLIGPGEARSVLDSVRAARQLDQVSLSDKTVVWGHSQGGGAALWAGIIAKDYAPDVPLAGIGAVAPASDLPTLATTLGTTQGGVLFASYLLEAYAAAYHDVKFDRYVRPDARTPLHDFGELCLTDAAQIVSVGRTLPPGQPFYADAPTTGALGQRLRENDPTGPITAPLFIGQGTADRLVLPPSQAAYVAGRCSDDPATPLEYRTYKGREHINVIASDSRLPVDLVDWTADRFAGRPAPTTC
ncbi:MAG: lipase family protein [Marmoricola sp.]